MFGEQQDEGLLLTAAFGVIRRLWPSQPPASRRSAGSASSPAHSPIWFATRASLYFCSAGKCVSGFRDQPKIGKAAPKTKSGDP